MPLRIRKEQRLPLAIFLNCLRDWRLALMEGTVGIQGVNEDAAVEQNHRVSSLISSRTRIRFGFTTTARKWPRQRPPGNLSNRCICFLIRRFLLGRDFRRSKSSRIQNAMPCGWTGCAPGDSKRHVNEKVRRITDPGDIASGMNEPLANPT